jgi:hypothetical protein
MKKTFSVRILGVFFVLILLVTAFAILSPTPACASTQQGTVLVAYSSIPPPLAIAAEVMIIAAAVVLAVNYNHVARYIVALALSTTDHQPRLNLKLLFTALLTLVITATAVVLANAGFTLWAAIIVAVVIGLATLALLINVAVYTTVLRPGLRNATANERRFAFVAFWKTIYLAFIAATDIITYGLLTKLVMKSSGFKLFQQIQNQPNTTIEHKALIPDAGTAAHSFSTAALANLATN